MKRTACISACISAWLLSLCASLLLLLSFFSVRAARAKDKPIVWKAVNDALLRVNGVAPKDWGISQAGKKNDPLLLEIGNRFLLIETHNHRVFEIDPASVQRKSGELRWSLSDRPAQPLPSEWTAEDLGSAFRIAFTLPKDSLAFELQLEHPPDVGELPAHVAGAAPTRRRY